MNLKHGTTRTRMNDAKGMAHYLVEQTKEIETIWLLSEQGVIDEEEADARIRGLSEEMETFTSTFLSHIKYIEPK